VYVDFQDDNVPIQISIRAGTGASVTRKWNIKISQIDCASPERGRYLTKEQYYELAAK
jgi:hypothetical protein